MRLVTLLLLLPVLAGALRKALMKNLLDTHQEQERVRVGC